MCKLYYVFVVIHKLLFDNLNCFNNMILRNIAYTHFPPKLVLPNIQFYSFLQLSYHFPPNLVFRLSTIRKVMSHLSHKMSGEALT